MNSNSLREVEDSKSETTDGSKSAKDQPFISSSAPDLPRGTSVPHSKGLPDIGIRNMRCGVSPC
jgi:hypothetical protein